ncbi:MAG TPA: penicillin-binding protein 1A [Oscillospiraceae bacterium]|nr:penicillin-binding protein 1A [Oscillospiraceae bacterium]
MRRVTRFVLITAVVVFLLSVGAMGFLAATVTGMGEIPDVQTPLTSTFYDYEGNVLATRFEQNRFEVPLDKMPKYLPEAFIAIEDHRFYDHFGLDLVGLARAMLRNLRAGRIVEGGSTITQQLAKNLFLTHEQTMTRKLQEMLLTIQLERKFSKDEILEKYLNTIYFGHSAYGVEAAARTYYNKSVQDLTLAEAALMAGITRGPAYYSPYNSEETRAAAFKRQNTILTRMVDEGFIEEQEKKEALAQELVFEGRDQLKADKQFGAYYIDYLINNEIMAKITDYTTDPQIIYRGGLHIYTTLDNQLQQIAEEVFANPGFLPETVKNDQGEDVPLQAALVALDPADGSIRALVGGRNFQKSQFNRAVNKRSPGSSFKPFTYAAALEQGGYTAATIRESGPVSYKIPGNAEPYQPTEYGERYYGSLRLREAIARSSNIVAVKINEEISPAKTVDLAHRVGITSKLDPVLSLPLGSSEVTPLEMAVGYATFANQGMKVEPRFITKITDTDGRVLYQAGAPQRTAVLEPRIAYLLTEMMTSVMKPGGTASSLGPLVNHPVAAKTGTSQGHRDSYMAGYAPDLVTAVWVGNDDNLSLGWGQTGSVRAGQIWANFMRQALQDTPAKDFERPAGLVEVLICPETGLLHNTRCSLEPIRELFIAGTEPTKKDSWPECQYCPQEPDWNWGDGWWFNRPGRDGDDDDDEPEGQQPPNGENEAEEGNNGNGGGGSFWEELFQELRP